MNSLDYQNIFHEIKNTITLINSSIQLLNNKCPQLESETCWDNIKDEITYLKNMILEISKAGSLEQIQKEPLNLNTMIENICQCMKDSYPNMQWNLNLCENLPSVPGDSIKLKQAVLNLIKNSAETDTECITITTKTEAYFIKIIITDFGGGIPAELEDKIFDLFTTTKTQGTGLGLFITKQIVEHHDGTLHVENHPNKGCSFCISLPVPQ